MVHQRMIILSYNHGHIIDPAVYHAGKDKVDDTVTAGKGDRRHQAQTRQLRDKIVVAVGENDSQGIGIGAYHISSPPFTFSLIMALGPIFAWSPI